VLGGERGRDKIVGDSGLQAHFSLPDRFRKLGVIVLSQKPVAWAFAGFRLYRISISSAKSAIHGWIT
jgi:hypothetical protein